MTPIANGIDVSEFNGHLDWEKIKPQIDFAIIRAGYGKDYANQDDAYFERNASECERLGIAFGVYLYSYATDVESARREAQHVLRLIGDKAFSYPVYYDLEDEDTVGRLTNAEIADIAEAFCGTLEQAGFFAGVYANLNWFQTRLTSDVFDKWTKWVAQYNSQLTYDKAVGMWQHTSRGTLDGVDGNFDLSECYVDFPNIIVGGGFNNNSGENGNQPNPPLRQGDVDGDGEITAADARLALRASAGLEILTAEQAARADMDGDGIVTAADARTILRISAGLEAEGSNDGF